MIHDEIELTAKGKNGKLSIPLNPQPLQSHPSLDITLSLSLITPLDHIHDTPSPPYPPQPQSPSMGHPLYYNYNDYHRDDDHILNMFSTGNPFSIHAMRILDELLTDAIKEIKAYKDYDVDCQSVVVPMIQPQSVESFQGAPRTLTAPKSPKPKKFPQKKKDRIVRESIEPKKPLRIKITIKKTDVVIPASTSSKIDYDKLIKAQQVSIAMTISVKEAGEKENIVIVEKAVLANEAKQMVEGDEENPVEVCQENIDTRLEPGSHKERSMEKRNNDDNDQHTVDALIKMKNMGSLEIRDGEKQTPIHTPSRSPRTNLSSILKMDKDDLVLIILRRPFLATARAVIDVHEGKLSLRVGSETVTFNIGKSMKSKYSRDNL
nr:hypothetical protein [Tanacetum cinerariifolium]